MAISVSPLKTSESNLQYVYMPRIDVYNVLHDTTVYGAMM